MTPLMYGGFGAMKAMCTQFNETPEKASRPFDADREPRHGSRAPALLF